MRVCISGYSQVSTNTRNLSEPQKGFSMTRIKLFKSVESELEALEAEVNEWIEASGAKVSDIKANIAPQSNGAGGMGSFSPSDILIAVTYE